MDDKVLEKGYQLTFENAKQLIRDADILKEHERYPRAYTLFQLAIEEIGKCRIISVAIIEFYQGKSITKKYFSDKGFFQHKRKTRSSLTAEYVAILIFEMNEKDKLDESKRIIEQDYQNVSQINHTKNKSLYVDIEDEKFVSPNENITREMVDDIEYKAKIRLESEEIAQRPLSEMEETAKRIDKLEEDPEKIKSLIEKLFAEH